MKLAGHDRSQAKFGKSCRNARQDSPQVKPSCRRLCGRGGHDLNRRHRHAGPGYRHRRPRQGVRRRIRVAARKTRCRSHPGRSQGHRSSKSRRKRPPRQTIAFRHPGPAHACRWQTRKDRKASRRQSGYRDAPSGRRHAHFRGSPFRPPPRPNLKTHAPIPGNPGFRPPSPQPCAGRPRPAGLPPARPL